MTYFNDYLRECADLVSDLDVDVLERMVTLLCELRERHGRLFILGVGGSAANASHAVNDFRKICGIEAYAPTDNVAELTAWTNDEGWRWSFRQWLVESRLSPKDVVLVLSVGGGSRDASPNLVEALDWASRCPTTILGIVGRNGGATAHMAHACIVIPPKFPDRITPHTESLQAVVWHALVNHPLLRQA